MIGSGGRTGPRGAIFPGNSFYIAKRCPYKWVEGSGGRTGPRGPFFPETPFTCRRHVPTDERVAGGGRRTGSFSGGGAVMAPLRRAGLTGSLLVQGDRSDLGLRGREGCRAGLPFRSALLREADREAGRGRGWATGAMDAGSRW